MHPDDFARRLADYRGIGFRAMEAVGPDNYDEALAVVHRAALQMVAFVRSTLDPGSRLRVEMDAMKAAYGPPFEEAAGRPFDPELDAVTWEEVNALSHPSRN